MGDVRDLAGIWRDAVRLALPSLLWVRVGSNLRKFRKYVRGVCKFMWYAEYLYGFARICYRCVHRGMDSHS